MNVRMSIAIEIVQNGAYERNMIRQKQQVHAGQGFTNKKEFVIVHVNMQAQRGSQNLQRSATARTNAEGYDRLWDLPIRTQDSGAVQ